jgi:hypothetical protein
MHQKLIRFLLLKTNKKGISELETACQKEKKSSPKRY